MALDDFVAEQLQARAAPGRPGLAGRQRARKRILKGLGTSALPYRLGLLEGQPGVSHVLHFARTGCLVEQVLEAIAHNGPKLRHPLPGQRDKQIARFARQRRRRGFGRCCH